MEKDNKDIVEEAAKADAKADVKAEDKKAKPKKGEKKEKKKFQMPSAYVIVFMVLILVAILTFFIPVSVIDPGTGEVVYNASYDDAGNVIKGTGTDPNGFWDVLIAPVKGFINASDVAIALLIAGGFLNVLALTGGLEAAIGKMLQRLKGNVLIILLTLMTALMGTVFGFWEEIIAFSLVVIPLFVLAGYDVMLGMGVLFLGATVGNMAAVVNPFATGAAVAALGTEGLTMGSGIIFRMVLFVILFIIVAIMLVRYGSMVKAKPEKSALFGIESVKTSLDEGEDHQLPEMTKKRAWSTAAFLLMIVVLIIGYIPWADLGGDRLSNIVNAPFIFLEKIPLVGDLFGAGHVTYFGDWGFDEFSVLFFIGALALLVINRIKMDDFLDSFLAGAKDLLGVVIVLSIAKGIAVVMGTPQEGMSVTLVYWISNALADIPQWTFAIFAVIAYLLIGLALQSTSGVAGISMPILGAVAAALFTGSAIGSNGGQIILISAFTIGLNFMCLIYPGAVNLGVSEKFGVPYNSYLKFMLKYSIPLLLIATVLLSLAPYLGLIM